MDRVEKIEHEIRGLSAEELSSFREWFHEFDANAWDAEIEADVLGGKLDALADKAVEAHRTGKTTPL